MFMHKNILISKIKILLQIFIESEKRSFKKDNNSFLLHAGTHTTHNLDLAIYFLRAETEDLYIA